jgi:hypothetical protein
MTGRERIRAALEHRNPDKVPVDFGASTVTRMSLRGTSSAVSGT